MSRYGRDPDRIQLDIADALAHGEAPLDYLERQARARGWGGEDA